MRHRNHNSIECLSNRNPQTQTTNPHSSLDFFASRSSYVRFEFLQGSADAYRGHEFRGRKYSLSFTSCDDTLFLFSRLSDLWTILRLALFPASRPPSFLAQGTVIWHLTPGSEWLNGWFFAVSAVTSSVRGFVLHALPHSYTLLLKATTQSYADT